MARHEPILLGEDDDNDVLLMRMAVKEAGIANELIVARDGREVLEQLARLDPGEKPCLLFLDLKMPLLDGFEVLERLRERPDFADIPVVVLTSSMAESDVTRALASGARDYLIKPMALSGLTEAVREVYQRLVAQEAA